MKRRDALPPIWFKVLQCLHLVKYMCTCSAHMGVEQCTAPEHIHYSRSPECSSGSQMTHLVATKSRLVM